MCFRSDKDDAGGQLDPTEIAARATIQPSGDAAELGQEGMATLDGAADAAHPRLAGVTASGRLHPEAGRVGAGVGGAVAIGAVGTGTRQIPRVRAVRGPFGGRRPHDHRLQNNLRLHPVVGPRLGHHGAQRQATLLGR